LRCNDCHTAWRTVFAQHHSLTLFAGHLQEPSNRFEFEQCLLAGLILRREGVDIARRTVAKYREALRIPNSVQRRREKAVPA
jgi:hypothetical protein